jgi:hypothetical protein
MNFSDKQAALKRLDWVEKARIGIIAAIDDAVDPTFKVFPTVDPLKFILKISLTRPLRKSTRDPLRQYLRCWAQEYGCDVPIINIENNRVQAQVLTRQKVWTRNAQGRFKPKERFVRKSQ